VSYHLGTSVSEVVAPIDVVGEAPRTNDAGRLTAVERKGARIGALIGVVVFILVATWGQPWNVFQESVFSSDMYDVQARSIAHGHLDISPNVAGVEGFPLEDGTQIYFGVGPSLLRLPLTGWTDIFDRRLGVLSMAIAVGVLGLAASRLLKRAKCYAGESLSLAPKWFGVMAFAAIVFTPALFFASRSVVYHEAVLWGCAAVVAALDLVIRWWRERSWRNFFAAVAVATFAISCRPTSGIAAAIALGLFGAVLLWRRNWWHGVGAIGGAVFALLGFVVVNWLRFKTVYTQPYEIQVMTTMSESRRAFLEESSGSILGLEYVPTTFVRYFSPVAIGFQRIFPFVNFGSRASVIGNASFEATYHSSSLTLGAPVLFALACCGAWWTVLKDRSREWTILSFSAVLATVGTFAFGVVNHRYLGDLIPALLVLACPGVWVVARKASGWSNGVRKTLLVGAIVVSLGAMWVQVGLAIETRAFSMTPTESDTRTVLASQNALDRRLFDQPFPHLQQRSGDTLPTEGISDGSVVILDDCAGLYRFDGYNWAVAERKPGAGRRYQLTGTITEETRPIVQGPGWTVTATRTPEGVVFVYDASYGRRDVSAPVALPDGEVTLEVIADQAGIPMLSVRDRDRHLFDAWFLGIGGAVPGDGWVSTPGAAPLCESLLSRLED